MSGASDRIEDMLERAREFSAEEVLEWERGEAAKWGLVGALRTTPEGFREYLRKRGESDRRSRKGMIGR